MKFEFYLRFRTRYGQAVFVSGNLTALGENDPAKAFPLQYLNEEFWYGSIEVDPSEINALHYRYVFLTEAGEYVVEGEKDRKVDFHSASGDILLIDSWNDESFVENAFNTAPFHEVFFKDKGKGKAKKDGKVTHTFKVKAPLLHPDEAVCMLGSTATFGSWDTSAPLLLTKKGSWWSIGLNLTQSSLPVSYKYGVVKKDSGEFLRFESGDNRVLFSNDLTNKQTIVHDAFVHLPNTTWKGAGVAIPVFSLRSAGSFGIGEFTDIKLLADWAKETGLKLIQLLPINDTSATFTWKDSYPYAAISAFALHPIYINLQKVGGKKGLQKVKSLTNKQKQLNELAEIDYDQVIKIKLDTLQELYAADDMAFLEENSFLEFFEDNRAWLVPYAAFCFYRDKYKTADFSKWKTGAVYNEAEIAKLTGAKSKSYKQIAFFYFVQYHLHLQLKEAVDHAHKKGIAIKGDIPIGIYRYGADAWTAPSLYNMDMQAGAPPDDFAVKGQNWGFPTYNWQKMEEDHFEWWKLRFHQMSNYFDAFRIDHILGFFRIWSIPTESIDGIMGRFIPALPVSAHEFGERGIWFDYDRFCKPFIIDAILYQTFDGLAQFVKENFLVANEKGGYDLQEAFNTQRKVQDYFATQPQSDDNEKLQRGLFDLVSNVLLFEEAGSNGQQFHFRIAMDTTSSFQHLDEATRHKLKDLYVNYFFRRQDEFWKQEALKKLPALKAATDMLICGEDLGMVPHSVPEVMQRLGILSLEVQRMPKDHTIEFFHPRNAPYLSVVTPSTHDMSTIRGWWEEDRERTQRFFNRVLGEWGPAPYFCEPWVNRAIVLQHLYSPAMWSIFQLQDILGMSDTLRRENPAEERINLPANPQYYWNYRMHIGLEQLIGETAFNRELKDYITNSGRGNQ
ncbi:4-alpha-glucanotransferase [Flavisolibacter nicotianae]|uniref:4-alpha-glucanotransferase n=1 Tax=Flavisolibacter nicotianae TaxID=2364882 RepID=UPI000EB05EF6|nr:4-alpha-glucanotransferase [Flavisolibacter nicotianae]